MKKASRLSDAEYDYVFQRTPRICLDFVIKRFGTESRILLTKRAIKPYKGCWHLPGGRILFRETLAQAIKRILAAELGLAVRPAFPKQIGVIEHPREGRRHSISIVYILLLRADESDGIRLDHQAASARFFDPNELPARMVQTQRRFLENYNISSF